MFLDIYNNAGARYIRISESYRIEKDGVRVARKRQIKSIGPVSKFDDGKPEFEKRLKDSFKACDPIIPELKPYCAKQPPKEIYHLSVHSGTDECIGHPKLFASCLLDKLMEEVGLCQFVGTYKNYDMLNYDVLGFLKLAVYGKILNPDSKIATVKQNNDYYSPIIKENSYEYNVYDMLDFVYHHKEAIFHRIDANMQKKFGRTTNRIYYDVTNFFFETEKQDRITDEKGDTVLTGLRQNGVCKEERSLPIVQMGLLMDEQGYPISIETFPGNTLDHQTLIKSFESSPVSGGTSRYIFVSDKGIGCGGNPKYAVAGGNGFIVSKSIRKCTKEEKEWILNEDGYLYNGGKDFKLKSRTYPVIYKLNSGTELKGSEKQVVYWSRKFYEKEYTEKKSFYDFVQKLMESPETFRITKVEAGLIGRYTKKSLVNVKSGEIVNTKDLKAMLDVDKITAEMKLLGYYSIVTSETQMSDEAVIDTYHNLVRIEDEFRVMKSALETRPIYVRTPEHITAHLVLCTIALLFIRIIQNKIKDNGFIDTNSSYGLSADRIIKALNRWTVEKLADEYYRFNDLTDNDLKLILDAFDIDIPLKLYRIGDLKHIKQTIEDFQCSANL